MIGLLGKKIGMTQIFDKDGQSTPATVLEVGPCHVTDLRTQERDGYTAVQIGYGAVKEKRLTKAKAGQLKKAGTPLLRFIREIRTPEVANLSVGSELHVDNFQEGEFVDVIGTTIGKGFQGVVKRHGFKGGEKAHGTKMGREPGSVGASAFPSRTIKGLRLPGQMGNVRQTTQNLKVVKVDAENHLLVVKGAVPGYDGNYLVIRSALKQGITKNKKWKVAEKGSTNTSASSEVSQGSSDKAK